MSATTFLMFTGQAEEAMTVYTSVISNSAIGDVKKHPDGSILHASFTLGGQAFECIDTPPAHAFSFTPSVSIAIRCQTAEELDEIFDALSTNGSVMMPLGAYPFSKLYAWFNDKFGVSWQLRLNE